MSDPLRYVLIGTGGQAGYWPRTALPRLRDMGKAIPVAAADVSPDRLQLARDQLGVPEQYCYSDPAEALERRRADFAIIDVPTPYQERMIDLALTFDLHILAEGPIAESMEQACRIYRKARGLHKKKMAVASGQRYEREAITLEKLVRGGRYGRLDYIVARFAENSRKRGSWGRLRHDMPDVLLIEAAANHFDVLRALAGDDAQSINAVTWNPPWGEYHGDSAALVTIEMENGVHCLYEGAKANASALNPWGSEYFRAECQHASIVLDQKQITILSGGGPWEHLREEPAALLDQPVWGNAWLAEMFCDWLAGGDEPPNTLKDHMFCAAMTFAAVESARTGRAVNVKDFLQKHLEASRLRNSSRNASDDE